MGASFCLPMRRKSQKPKPDTAQPAALTATQQQVMRDARLQARKDRKKRQEAKHTQRSKGRDLSRVNARAAPSFDGIVNFGGDGVNFEASRVRHSVRGKKHSNLTVHQYRGGDRAAEEKEHNPFEGNARNGVVNTTNARVPDFLGVDGGLVSVSHNMSRNRISAFPHFSFNDVDAKDATDGEDDYDPAMAARNDRDDSKLSSASMDDDVSVRYTTPTMASNHIVRPLPSPSSLSVPQPSIGSGIQSREHSIVHSTLNQPANKRQSSLPSTFFPSMLASPSDRERDRYSQTHSQNQHNIGADLDASPLSAYPHSSAAASPPSATSPLTTQSATVSVQSLPPFMHARSHSHSHNHSAYSLYASSPPTSNSHLTLNTQSAERAAQIFDDSEVASETQTSSLPVITSVAQQQQRSPRHALTNTRSSGGGSLPLHSRRGLGASAMSLSLSLPESREAEGESDEDERETMDSGTSKQRYPSHLQSQSTNSSKLAVGKSPPVESARRRRTQVSQVSASTSALADMYAADFGSEALSAPTSTNAANRGSEGLANDLGAVRYVDDTVIVDR